MSGWKLFWTLVGFIVFIVVLIFLYFYKPFETLFTQVIYGIGFDNAIFWAVVIIAIVGFCGYHWRAYRLYIVQQRRIEAMVMASLRGSAFTAILLSAGAALQAILTLCVYLLGQDYSLGAEFGRHLAAVIVLMILAAVFCIIFWLLRIVRPATQG